MSPFDLPQTMPRYRLLLAILVLAACAQAHAANPLSFVTETFGHWKDRLFGRPARPVPEMKAPPSGPIALPPGTRVRFGIDDDAPQNDFSKGRSRYRVIELPEELEHAAVRVQVIARKNPAGHGNVVFKPLLYVIEGDDFRAPVEVKPLHLDIRPFRKSRLLGCVTLDKVRRIAVATTPNALGKSYESEVRDAVKAPTQGGFYYTTDAVKTKLPFAATGDLVLEVTREAKAGEGC
ncbi:hypothetical protein EV148_105244 [Dokdonella fugitiva]|jgi:hypothetical protein|uniref:Uncharacterized protein n=2 Tax=Dokdonella fugitiva TaxID=328517 RepID=A0A4R2I8X7_9GAMM|nr:hypothetical protein EV148_105244 [Dokdonella fugitiva]